MVDFRPFSGIRFDASIAGRMEDLICPPYDVISPDHERTLLERNPNNMVSLELAEIDGPVPEGRYRGAAASFADMLQRSVLRADPAPAYYVLRQRFAGAGGGPMERYGLFGALRLEELGTGVLPHEDTRSGPKADRLALIEETAANFSPIFMLYRDPTGEIEAAISRAKAQEPQADFSVDGEEFTLWSVAEPDAVARIASALAPQPAYVADGHHRYETALTYLNRHDSEVAEDAPSRFVLTVMVDFDDPGLLIGPYYRVLRGLDEAQLAKVRGVLATLFVSRPSGTSGAEQLAAVVATIGQGGVTFGVVDEGGRHMVLTPANDLIPEPDPSAPPGTQMRAIEAVVLQEMVLRPALGDGFGAHLALVHDSTEALDMVQRGDGQIAFFIKGVPADVFEAVVGAGIRLPAKSTYFYPKLPSGLVIHSLRG